MWNLNIFDAEAKELMRLVKHLALLSKLNNSSAVTRQQFDFNH